MLKELARGTLAYSIAGIVGRGAQVATLLALPAILPPADYGALQLILTIAIVANFVMPLEITQGLARFFPGASAVDKPAFAASAWWFTVGGVALTLAIGQAFAPPLCRLLFGATDLLPAFRLGLVFIALNALFYFIQNQFRWSFDVRSYLLTSILFAVGTAGLTLGLGLALAPALLGALAGQIGGTLLAGLLGLARLRRTLFRRPERARVAEMLRFSLPLVPAQIALFASLYLGRLILNGMTGLAEVGLFTFASQIAAAAALLTIGLQAALTPLIMARHAEPETPGLVARVFEAFVAAAALFVLALGLIAPELIGLLGRPEYLASAPLVLILTAATMISQSYLFAPGFTIARRTTRQLWVSLAGALVSVLANALLIAYFGIVGAAWASLLSAIAFSLSWWLLSQPLYRIPVRWGAVGLVVLAAAAAAGISSAWAGGSAPLPVRILLVLAVAGVIASVRLIRIPSDLLPPGRSRGLHA